MKTWKRILHILIIGFSLLGSGCSRREPEVDIDLNQLFFDITQDEYSANWNFAGDETLASVSPGDRANILDYLIVKSEDPLSPNLFIFFKAKESSVVNVSKAAESIFRDMNMSDEWSAVVELTAFHQEGDYHFYILSRRADEYKRRILEYFE